MALATYNIWAGRFVSDSSGSCFGLPMVKGRIYTVLPMLIEDTNDCNVVLNYDGFYRSGQKSEMKISYSKTLEGQGRQVGVSGGFKGASTLTQQSIDFKIDNVTDKLIEGTYDSTNPGDRGTFYIKKL